MGNSVNETNLRMCDGSSTMKIYYFEPKGLKKVLLVDRSDPPAPHEPEEETGPPTKECTATNEEHEEQLPRDYGPLICSEYMNSVDLKGPV